MSDEQTLDKLVEGYASAAAECAAAERQKRREANEGRLADWAAWLRRIMGDELYDALQAEPGWRRGQTVEDRSPTPCLRFTYADADVRLIFAGPTWVDFEADVWGPGDPERILLPHTTTRQMDLTKRPHPIKRALLANLHTIREWLAQPAADSDHDSDAQEDK